MQYVHVQCVCEITGFCASCVMVVDEGEAGTEQAFWWVLSSFYTLLVWPEWPEESKLSLCWPPTHTEWPVGL